MGIQNIRLMVIALLSWVLLNTGPLARALDRPGPDQPGPAAALTLAQALTRVEERNLELAAASGEIQAAAGRVRQAGLKPNPELNIGIENFAATREIGFFGLSETTVQLSQLVERGGKRARRIEAAQRLQERSTRQVEVKRVEVLTTATLAFADVLAAQQRLANQRELTRLAEAAHRTVSERVVAGKVSPVEETRSAVALASAKLEEDKRSRELVTAKERLAALWGGHPDDFDLVAGLFDIPPAPAVATGPAMESNPDYRLAAAEVSSRQAELALEQAARKPDLTVSAGFRYLREPRLGAWVAGITIPLPFADKRQGAIAEAQARLNQSLAEQRAVGWRLQADSVQARRSYETALMEATALKENILPGARRVLESLEEGYQLGKFDYLNVLDAQRTYAELQGRRIDAVAAGLKAAIELERLGQGEFSSLIKPGR